MTTSDFVMDGLRDGSEDEAIDGIAVGPKLQTSDIIILMHSST